MRHPSHPSRVRHSGPSLDPASVNLARIPPDVRAAVRAALAARWEAMEPVDAARFAVARQFRLTILTVEAIELEPER